MKAVVQGAIPVLRVADVGRSIAWYREVLGFDADPFPDSPPYVFAILCHGKTEIMIRWAPGAVRDPNLNGWDVYLRLAGGRIREIYADLQRRATIVRRLERMPYPFAEFEIQDPDGYRLCISEFDGEANDLPRAVE